MVLKVDSLIKERNDPNIPKLAGQYSDSNNQKLVLRATDYSNTFTVSTSDGKSSFRTSLTRIEPGLFLVQADDIGLKTKIGEAIYGITVAKIDNKTVTLYFFQGLESKVIELATKRKVQLKIIKPIEKDETQAMPMLAAYDSVDDLIGFFKDLLTLSEAHTVVFTRK
jgi:hypothetical protein